MKAMILAAGKGTRMRPLTNMIPKVLLPVADIPVILHTLRWLKSHDINEIAINLNHLGHQIEDLLGDGSELGVSIRYSREHDLLGTAGGVKNIGDFFTDSFIVVYGDMLADFNLTGMINRHREKQALATLALFKTDDHRNVGIVHIDQDGKIGSFIEKPFESSQNGDMANGAIYIMEKEVLDYIPHGQFFDFARDLFPLLLQRNLPLYGYVLAQEDYLLDIGTNSNYQKANKDAELKRITVRSS